MYKESKESLKESIKLNKNKNEVLQINGQSRA
jgi:tRNA G37 N-methylase Trm5